MRISDWSSDVCSSDLNRRRAGPGRRGRPRPILRRARLCKLSTVQSLLQEALASIAERGPFVFLHDRGPHHARRSEEHTSELQSLMRISYAVFCLKKKNKTLHNKTPHKRSHTTK